MAEKR